MTIAVYPGSFDPVTLGHLNLVERGLRIFDRLVVAVATNQAKTPLFTVEERIQMIHEAIGENDRVKIDTFSGLLVDFARNHQANIILRGLRAISDFEFEFQMTHMNRRLHPGLEIVFMMTDEEYFFVSSQLVREVASLRGQVTGLVPANVERKLIERFAP